MIPALPSWSSLQLVSPELWLIVGMCAVILTPFLKRASVVLHTLAATVTLSLAILSAGLTLAGAAKPLFAGMLTIDPFSQFFKIILLVFTLLVVGQWVLVGRSKLHPHDVPDFLCLVLGAAFGMALLASASNLLMIFMAVEASSYPSYALAGFRKQSRRGAEGALKYVVFGSAASAVMLYGMSLIYGNTGTLDLATVAQKAAVAMSPTLALGIMAMLVGVAFKLSAVPLHFWCPDVFEGAPIEVTTFLSVASKGAAVCLLVRIAQAFGAAGEFQGLALGLAILGGVTATWGNLVAYHQNNIKRMLAYSSIAHAGYMIMAASVLALANTNGAPAGGPMQDVAGAILFYLVVYLFMNLGAFTVAALVAQTDKGSEDIRDYAGLLFRAPLLGGLMVVFLLSLFGMPGLGGFMGKILLAVALLQAGGLFGYALIGVLLVNTLLSLYFYMRPVYYMVFVPDHENRPAPLLSGLAVVLLGVCVLGVLWTGILPGDAQKLAHDFAAVVISPPSIPTVALGR